MYAAIIHEADVKGALNEYDIGKTGIWHKGRLLCTMCDNRAALEMVKEVKESMPCGQHLHSLHV